MNTSNVNEDECCEIKFKNIELLEGRFNILKGLNKKIRLRAIKRTSMSSHPLANVNKSTGNMNKVAIDACFQ